MPWSVNLLLPHMVHTNSSTSFCLAIGRSAARLQGEGAGHCEEHSGNDRRRRREERPFHVCLRAAQESRLVYSLLPLSAHAECGVRR